MNKRFVAIIALLAALLLMAGCSAPPAQNVKLLDQGLWQVVKYREASGRPVRPLLTGGTVGRLLVLQFDGSGAIAGDAGINRFGAKYDAREDGYFSLSGITATDNTATAALVDQESALFAAYEAARTFVVDDTSLALYNRDGQLVVRLKHVKLPVFEKTGWQCAAYRNAAGAMVAPIADSNVEIAFADGGLSGVAGVDTFGGSYRVKKSALTVYSATLTSAEEVAPEMAAQESAFLADLEAAARYDIDVNALVLYDAKGERLAELVSASH